MDCYFSPQIPKSRLWFETHLIYIIYSFYLLNFHQLSHLISVRRSTRLTWCFTGQTFGEVQSEQKHKTRVLFFMFKYGSCNEPWNYFPQFNGAELVFNYAWVKSSSAAWRKNKERWKGEQKERRRWMEKKKVKPHLIRNYSQAGVNYERTETPELTCVRWVVPVLQKLSTYSCLRKCFCDRQHWKTKLV